MCNNVALPLPHQGEMARTMINHCGPLEESDLAGLLNDPIVEDSYAYWDDVGLEIGFKQSDIDVFRRDNHHSVEDCMKAMLTKLLRNNRDELTLLDLHQAIGRVKDRRKRKTNRKETEKEEKDAEFAVNQLERLLVDWDTRNKTIDTDLKKLVAALREQESWISCKQGEWEKENDEWKQGEIARRKAKILRSSKKREFKEIIDCPGIV